MQSCVPLIYFIICTPLTPSPVSSPGLTSHGPFLGTSFPHLELISTTAHFSAFPAFWLRVTCLLPLLCEEEGNLDCPLSQWHCPLSQQLLRTETKADHDQARQESDGSSYKAQAASHTFPHWLSPQCLRRNHCPCSSRKETKQRTCPWPGSTDCSPFPRCRKADSGKHFHPSAGGNWWLIA